MIELNNAALFEVDAELIREDISAESVTIFCQRRPVVIGSELVADLKRLAEQREGKIFRYCLHDAPEAEHHDMIILQNEGPIFRPHKHPVKEEVHHVMEGQLGVIVFEDDGAIATAYVLQPGQIDRIGKNMYHTVCPVSPQVIYHENKPGPFLGEGDAVYPLWAPEDDDQQAKINFDKRMLTALNKAPH